ncbi:MAG TPA: hypothetical protein VLZ77_10095 [Acidimicrobiales bacterium]|nr:hypothetical protein [Acidimicrobiales bacterium]
MLRRRAMRWLLVLALMSVGSVVGAVGLPSAPHAVADTDPTTLVGEGGSFFEPVVDRLLSDDTAPLAPLNPAYTDVNVDQGIADFIGSGPGDFAADYAVSERPLTSAEAATALADGRTYAYVPFAATPVAVATLVPDAAKYQGQSTITSSEFCPHIPLSTSLLGALFGLASPPLLSWGDSRLSCASGSTTPPYSLSVAVWANLDPSMANQALMTLLDSDPGAKSEFDAGLANRFTNHEALTEDDTPSEKWPYAQNTIPGGDEALIGKLLDIDSKTNAPDTQAANWQLGATLPLSSVWTGAPLGVAWNIPTAAVQNAQGSFVAPSSAAAAAAEADATLASTSDPGTDNLVTFKASTTDAAAYNTDLMEEEYLVVPTSGLAPAKATKLAQFIRFVLGGTGQKDITDLGAAPATAAMRSAGLQVAALLSAQGVSTAASGATPGASAVQAASAGLSASTGAASSDSATDGAGGGDGSSPELAATGLDPWPVAGGGAVAVAAAELVRRRLRRRSAA